MRDHALVCVFFLAPLLCGTLSVSLRAGAPPRAVFLVIDAGGVPTAWIHSEAHICPTLEGLARRGVTFLSVLGESGNPTEALRRFVGTPTEGLLAGAARTFKAVELFMSRPFKIDLPPQVRLFVPDLRLPAFANLLTRLGPARPVEEEELQALQILRAKLGLSTSACEIELTRLLAGSQPPHLPDRIVFHYLREAAGAEGPLFGCAVLTGADKAHQDVGAARRALAATDRDISELLKAAGETPHRRELLFAYISLMGRNRNDLPSEHYAGTETCAVLVGPNLTPGLVVAKKVPLSSVRALLLAQAGLGPLPEDLPGPVVMKEKTREKKSSSR